MNDHLWGPSVHVDKSFTKIQARVRPPPSRQCLYFGNFWSGSPSLSLLWFYALLSVKFSGKEICLCKYQVCKSFNSSELNNKLANEDALLNIVLDYDERFYLWFRKMSKLFGKYFNFFNWKIFTAEEEQIIEPPKSNFELWKYLIKYSSLECEG